MTREKLIKNCKEISKENNIMFNYNDDEFIKVIDLKFGKDLKGYLIRLTYKEIDEINSFFDFKPFLINRLQKHNIIE